MRPRADLRMLLDERGSPVGRANEDLSVLLEHWSPEAPKWAWFRATGGDFDSPALALWARRQVLFLMAGVFRHFDSKMCHSPYTFAKLVDPGVSPASRRQVAEAFLQVPEHCLSVLCKRMRARGPSVEALVHEGGAVVEAWLRSAPAAIDFTERSHAQMRPDLRSTGRSKSATINANKVLCQQMRAEHLRRCQCDPSEAPPLEPLRNITPAPQRPSHDLVVAQPRSPNIREVTPHANSTTTNCSFGSNCMRVTAK